MEFKKSNIVYLGIKSFLVERYKNTNLLTSSNFNLFTSKWNKSANNDLIVIPNKKNVYDPCIWPPNGLGLKSKYVYQMYLFVEIELWGFNAGRKICTQG